MQTDLDSYSYLKLSENGTILLLWMEIQIQKVEWNMDSAEKGTNFHFQSERGSAYAYVLLHSYYIHSLPPLYTHFMKGLWPCIFMFSLGHIQKWYHCKNRDFLPPLPPFATDCHYFFLPLPLMSRPKKWQSFLPKDKL